MTETEKKTTDMLSQSPQFFGEVVKRIASWHDDEMRKLKERCANAGLQWFRGFRQTTVPQVPSISECGLHAAILAVDAPKVVGPFGEKCKCWEQYEHGLMHLKKNSTWFFDCQDVYAFCPFCGAARVKSETK